MADFRSNRNVLFSCKFHVVFCPKYRKPVLNPPTGIHRLVKGIKGRSSRVLRQQFRVLRTRIPTLWTNSYFVSSVGGAPLALIKQYIENQKRV
jgi:putative transposase